MFVVLGSANIFSWSATMTSVYDSWFNPWVMNRYHSYISSELIYCSLVSMKTFYDLYVTLWYVEKVSYFPSVNFFCKFLFLFFILLDYYSCVFLFTCSMTDATRCAEARALRERLHDERTESGHMYELRSLMSILMRASSHDVHGIVPLDCIGADLDIYNTASPILGG